MSVIRLISVLNFSCIIKIEWSLMNTLTKINTHWKHPVVPSSLHNISITIHLSLSLFFYLRCTIAFGCLRKNFLKNIGLNVLLISLFSKAIILLKHIVENNATRKYYSSYLCGEQYIFWSLFLFSFKIFFFFNIKEDFVTQNWIASSINFTILLTTKSTLLTPFLI